MSLDSPHEKLLMEILGGLCDVSDALYYRDPDTARAHVQEIKDRIRHHLHGTDGAK